MNNLGINYLRVFRDAFQEIITVEGDHDLVSRGDYQAVAPFVLDSPVSKQMRCLFNRSAPLSGAGAGDTLQQHASI